MDFALTEAQQLTRKQVHDFAAGEIRPESMQYDESQEFPEHWVKKMGALGLMGVFVPEAYGGSGLDNITYAITVEELSWGCASAGVIAAVNNGLACEPILRFGTGEQKQRWLPNLASGNWLGCYALTEPGSGSDAAAMRATAKREGDEWILNGTKAFVTNGLKANLAVTYARTGEKKYDISAFVVPTDTKGFQRLKKENKMGIRASDTMMFGFEDLRIPADHLLGEEGKGFNIALATLDGGRIGIASQAIGIAQAALDESLKFAQEREAFGKKISQFQAIQFKLSDMATEIDAARLLVYKAAGMKDEGKRHTAESSMAKLFASEMSNRVVDAAVQIHGGYGFVKEYLVEKLYRDQRITELYEGTSEIQRLVISRDLLGK
jgi:butyryl-CoA dehydrogenase